MLAALLRRMILGQVMIGAALGWWLHRAALVPLWLAFTVPLLVPALVMVLIDLWSCWVSRAGESSLQWWRSLFGENWAGILTFLLRQPWSFAAPVLLPATGGTPQVPVLLVHGYMCNHRIWDDVVPVLRVQGHAVFAVNLEPVFGSIDRYVDVIEPAVLALLEHTGQKQVALVGHSMGGLAIRAWMRAKGTDRTARVITLGTPHAGTKIHAPYPPPNGVQMQWNSAWLQALAASEGDATRALIHIAITPQDNIVFPQRVQTLTGITPVVFAGIGHVQMCTDPAVIDWVARTLRT